MSFNIALSGLNAINDELDTISNNIANSGTYGFKSSRANFASMYAGSQPIGVEVDSRTQSIDQGGGMLSTGRAMDAAIQGRGFFTTKDTSGALLYTRVGIFSTDPDGYVVDSHGYRAQGFGATPGSIGLGPLGDLRVPNGQITAQASDTLTYVGNLSADWTNLGATPFNPNDATTFNSSMVSVVYDSLGAQHTMTRYFVKTGTNQVTARYTFDGAPLATTTVLDFNANGQLTSPTGPVAIPLGTPTGATALTVNVNYAGTTQFAGEATTSVNSGNGYASGTLIGVEIEKDGSVMAKYSNGEKQSVGTLALATFANENGLVPTGETSWTQSKSSGNPVYYTPGNGATDNLSVGALEQSNVDVASQLVSLMSSQRNYQANTKVISTENQMMQSLMQAV